MPAHLFYAKQPHITDDVRQSLRAKVNMDLFECKWCTCLNNSCLPRPFVSLLHLKTFQFCCIISNKIRLYNTIHNISALLSDSQWCQPSGGLCGARRREVAACNNHIVTFEITLLEKKTIHHCTSNGMWLTSSLSEMHLTHQTAVVVVVAAPQPQELWLRCTSPESQWSIISWVSPFRLLLHNTDRKWSFLSTSRCSVEIFSPSCTKALWTVEGIIFQVSG